MKIVKPKVEILTPFDGEAVMRHLEVCGRTCYKSEGRISEDSAERLIRSLIKRGHESVLEHYSVTVRFTCDRGVSHEIVRHRIASYSQESTRYCRYTDEKFGGGISVIEVAYGIGRDPAMKSVPKADISRIYTEWERACIDAEKHYKRMLELGASPQIARNVLPTSTKTELVMTANIREWRHFLKLRCDSASHPQMREVAQMLLREFKKRAPVLFEDIGGCGV